MKILLVEPPVSPYDVPTGTFGLPPPYHLECLAGALLYRHEVAILDMRIDQDLSAELARFAPDMIGCSCVAANYHLALQVLREAKVWNPNAVTLLGGHHPSLVPLQCLETGVDYVVIGEGEGSLRELAATLERGADPATVAGIAYRDDSGEGRLSPQRPLLDMDGLPAPARHLSARYRDRQKYFRASWQPTDSIISSRGCPFKCTFCGLWKMNRGCYRYRDAELIADELETIEYPYVCFVDDNTMDHVRNASRLADAIKARGIQKTYELYGRSSTVVKHPELIEKWVSVGMKLLLIGLESTTSDRLEAMDKRVDLKTNQEAIAICHANGIEIVAYFIVDPEFTQEDFRRLGDYVEETGLTHPVYTILSPFPGTDLYELVKGRLITRRLDILDFFHTVLPTRLPLEEFYREFVSLYHRAYPLEAMRNAKPGDMAMVSPQMLGRYQEMDRRMSSLYAHHSEPAPDKAVYSESVYPSAFDHGSVTVRSEVIPLGAR
jgi:radical SAM superfamily enzyme YgiQ (UPF0313 family)